MLRIIVSLACLGVLLLLGAVTGQDQQQGKDGEKKLPKELVGKWVVAEGPQEGAAFEFFPNAKMVAKLNANGNEVVVNATVRVENKKLFSATKNPETGQEDIRVFLIRTLTAKEFVLEDDKGKPLWKMRRIAEPAKKS